MKLSRKIVGVLVLVLALFSASAFAVQRFLVYPSFVALEREEAGKDFQRSIAAVQDEISHLSTLCHEWAAWTDTYEYVADQNETYRKSNLMEETFATAKLNVVAVRSADGGLVWGRAYDLEAESYVELPSLLEPTLRAGHPILEFSHVDDEVTGIVMTSQGPLLLASLPIVTSERKGPIRGALIMGRFLDAKRVEAISKRIQVPLHTWRVDPGAEALPAPEAKAHAAMSPERTSLLQEHDDDMLHAYGTLADLYGAPALLLRADVTRQISARGKETTHYALLSILAAGALLLLLLQRILQRAVVEPLSQLTQHASRIRSSAGLSTPSGIDRPDEIGQLAWAFDGMVLHLRETRDELTDTARRVAVADVARTVLHNVGNVLTNINVSTAAMVVAHQDSRLNGLLQGTDLIAEHRDELADFLTENDRGRMLPEYLAQAAKACRRERSDFTTNLERLETAARHATEIVTRQSEFTSGPTLEQRLELDAAIADALSLVEPALRRHSVALERHVQAHTLITVDRLKLTQILVNLLTNAKEAMAGVDSTQRLLVVRAASHGDRIRIEVTDTGCGLSPEDEKRVFERGFSKKEQAGGLGLHYCATTALQLHGMLDVASAGPGQGATFTLDLPADPSSTPTGEARVKRRKAARALAATGGSA